MGAGRIKVAIPDPKFCLDRAIRSGAHLWCGDGGGSGGAVVVVAVAPLLMVALVALVALVLLRLVVLLLRWC